MQPRRSNPLIHPPSAAAPAALAAGPLGEDLAQPRVAAVDAGVVHTHVALQVVGPRVLVLAVAGAERAHVARRVVHQAMADHLVLALEAAAAHAPRAVRHGTVVRPRLRVHVGVRAATVSAGVGRARKGGRGGSLAYFSRYCVWKGAAVHPGYSHL